MEPDWHYEVGQRVERAVDVYDATKGVKRGTIIDRYSREIKYFSGGLALGPYPELYKVKFDDGSIGDAFFWSGLKPI